MVRTRIAPSPTGYPHIGTIYQVLFDYIYAKQHNGKFIMRLEDTDRARFVPGSEDVIYNSLEWFGLNPDESPKIGGPYKPYRQSERLPIYQKYIQELISKKHAYYCFCTKERLDEMRKEQQAKKISPMYDKKCLHLSEEEVKKNLENKITHVVRMNVPENETITINDMIVGKVNFESNTIDHQVILKSDGFPTYHLAVVVDDHLMEITHIFRGREWLPSTPKHVLLYRYFGWKIPEHGHLPLILNSDGKGKLSKRFSHASVDYYREQGYLPEAILNYLANLVWFHEGGVEIYSLDEFIKLFDIKKIGSQGARFDLQKLDWINGIYIRNMKQEILNEKIMQFYKDKNLPNDIVSKTIPLIQERIKKLSDYFPMCEFFFKAPEKYEVDIIGKKDFFRQVSETLSQINDWKAIKIGEELASLAKKLEIKNSLFFADIRMVIAGKKISPPLNESMEILGKDECLTRLTIK